MGPDVIATEVSLGMAERRKFPRYRYSAPIVVHPTNGPEVRGMALEISESGMSAMVGGSLKVGDTVELELGSGGPSVAAVRRCLGKLCGFEFLSLGPDQAAKIREMCRALPLYHSETSDPWAR
jgi:PilZ domain-containing protein